VTELRRVAATVVLVGLIGCAAPPPPADPAHVAEVETWRRERLEGLAADSGWLTLVGLHWLQPGPNRFGAAADNQIVLAGDGLPDRAGELLVSDQGVVTLLPAPGVSLVVNGAEVTTGRELATDAHGAPDVIGLGSLTLHLIERGDRVAVRVKDPHSAARRDFEGIDYFPVDSRFRVEGRFEPLPEPRPITIVSVAGTEEEMLIPGTVRFELGGAERSLLPIASSLDEKELFFVFRDATSGRSTYGAGRFLVTDPPRDGRVVLDFNKAYNPPCAFTPYATCPLPPRENILGLAVTAGEKAPQGH